jgi:hypothetical protein
MGAMSDSETCVCLGFKCAARPRIGSGPKVDQMGLFRMLSGCTETTVTDDTELEGGMRKLGGILPAAIAQHVRRRTTWANQSSRFIRCIMYDCFVTREILSVSTIACSLALGNGGKFTNGHRNRLPPLGGWIRRRDARHQKVREGRGHGSPQSWMLDIHTLQRIAKCWPVAKCVD